MNVSHLSRLGSLVALFMASRRNSASSAMVQRFLTGIAVMVGLSVTLGLCVGALLIAGLYGTYRGLVMNGLEPNVALFSIFVIMAFIGALLYIILRDRIRALREVPGEIMRSAETPIVGDAKNVINAFIDGLTGKGNSRSM